MSWTKLIFAELECTTITGRIAHEVNCVPVDNEESKYILTERTKEAMRPKHFTKFIEQDTHAVGQGFIHAGTIGASNAFGSFIVRLIHPYLPRISTNNSYRREEVHNLAKRSKLKKLLACLRMSLWTGYLHASPNTSIGP